MHVCNSARLGEFEEPAAIRVQDPADLCKNLDNRQLDFIVMNPGELCGERDPELVQLLELRLVNVS